MAVCSEFWSLAKLIDFSCFLFLVASFARCMCLPNSCGLILLQLGYLQYHYWKHLEMVDFLDWLYISVRHSLFHVQCCDISFCLDPINSPESQYSWTDRTANTRVQLWVAQCDSKAFKYLQTKQRIGRTRLWCMRRFSPRWFCHFQCKWSWMSAILVSQSHLVAVCNCREQFHFNHSSFLDPFIQRLRSWRTRHYFSSVELCVHVRRNIFK